MTTPAWLADALNLASIIGVFAAIGVGLLAYRMRQMQAKIAAVLAAQSTDLDDRLTLFPLRLAVYQAADQAAQFVIGGQYGRDFDLSLAVFQTKLFEARFMFDKPAFDALDDLWVMLCTCNDKYKEIAKIQVAEKSTEDTRALRTLEAVVLRKSIRLPAILRLSMQLDQKSTFATTALGASPLTQQD
jgi:hypothetical protein